MRWGPYPRKPRRTLWQWIKEEIGGGDVFDAYRDGRRVLTQAERTSRILVADTTMGGHPLPTSMRLLRSPLPGSAETGRFRWEVFQGARLVAQHDGPLAEEATIEAWHEAHELWLEKRTLDGRMDQFADNIKRRIRRYMEVDPDFTEASPWRVEWSHEACWWEIYIDPSPAYVFVIENPRHLEGDLVHREAELDEILHVLRTAAQANTPPVPRATLVPRTPPAPAAPVACPKADPVPALGDVKRAWDL